MTDYKHLTDEELAVLAGNRDEQAFEELYRRYEKLVRLLSRKFFLVGGDAEDLLQEGSAGLFNAVQTFNEEKGSFSSFAYRCINSRIINKINRGNAKKNEILSTALPIETLVGKQSSELSPLESLVGKEGCAELLARIGEVLSKKEKIVFDLYLNGYSYTEIAQELDLTPKQADNAISRSKQKIKQILKSRDNKQ